MSFLTSLIFNPAVLKTLLIGGLLIGGLTYYKHIQNDRERLRNENTLQKFANEQQKETIKTLQEDFRKIIEANNQLNIQLEKNRKETEKLRDVLFRETQGKASLEELARGKPSLVERRINSATQDVFNCLENISKRQPC
jgi:hypothetical protein